MFNQSISTSHYLVSATNKKWLFLIILGLMSSAGLVGTDVYLPLLPDIGKNLNIDSTGMQFTLGIYLFGLSIGQLIFGPLTDRFGRKNLLLIGMLIYFLASLSCAISLSYNQMIASRFIQALGASSGLVIGRAIVGDLFDVKEAGKIFSTIFPFVGMSPAISPVIGGYIGYHFGWQSTFIFTSIFACAVAILSIIYLPESLTYEKRQTLNFYEIFSAYPKLLANSKFITYVSAPCAAYIAYFSYISQSPFIFNAHGFGERAIGTFYITLSFAYVAGNISAKKLLIFSNLDKVLNYGFVIFNLAGLLIFITGIFHLSLFILIGAISLLTFANGFLIPLGSAGVISSFTRTAGYASGLLGFIQLGVAAISSSIIGKLSSNSVEFLGCFIFITTLGGWLLFIVSKNRDSNKIY